MAWITSHQALRDHPKVTDLMRLMEWDLDTTLGKLHRFWWWCVDYAENGDLRRHNDDRLAAAIGVLPGEPAKRFVAAMVEAGWLDRKPYFRIHDWWDYFGMFLQRKYSDQRERWETVKLLYSSKTVPRQLLSPHTNQPKPTNLNQPTKQERGRFEPPTPQDVCVYAGTIGFALDGEQFCSYYASKGWVVGKSPMRDWKAAVRTWKARQQQGKEAHGQRPDRDRADRAAALRAVEQPVELS